MNLDGLFERARIWRGGETPSAIGATVPTGMADLDALLPGGGWPRGALSEVMAEEGHGALSLLMPMLARLNAEDRWFAFIAPPYLPCAYALTAHGVDLAQVLYVSLRNDPEKLWGLEQCLRSGACAVVLGWFPQPPVRHLRRLQLAAGNGDSIACLFYPPDIDECSTPAALRIQVARVDGDADPTRVTIRIVKRRGGWPCGPITVSLRSFMASPECSPHTGAEPADRQAARGQSHGQGPVTS
ncbi:MAG: Cell division inhibitor SulA [Gammaproteobacteria bacterium]|nr:Cell division inhibitor SulA [Gammaproteobacteria bacterium]